jgi:hypothetical protein
MLHNVALYKRTVADLENTIVMTTHIAQQSIDEYILFMTTHVHITDRLSALHITHMFKDQSSNFFNLIGNRN